jgi:hypothetical protein
VANSQWYKNWGLRKMLGGFLRVFPSEREREREKIKLGSVQKNNVFSVKGKHGIEN